MMWAADGIECICVGRPPLRIEGDFVQRDFSFPITIGQVLKISHVESHPEYGVCLWFVGYPNNTAFSVVYFRPAITPTLEQDVEAIKRGLDPLVMCDLLLDEMDAK